MLLSLEYSELPRHLKDACPFYEDPEDYDFGLMPLDRIAGYAWDKQRLFFLLVRLHILNLQLAEHGKCYPPLILERAQTYEALHYDDLASFDAYVVYTLCQKALSDEFVTDLEAQDLKGKPWKPVTSEVRKLFLKATTVLVRCLCQLGATADAAAKRDELREQIALLEENDQKHFEWQEQHLLQPDSTLCPRPDNMTGILSSGKLSKTGHSRREIYPWSTLEPDRNTPESVAELNAYLAQIAPSLEAKLTALPSFDTNGNATGEECHQLGLFAKEDLKPGQEVLSEKSILTAIRPFEDAICDACGQDLEGISFEKVKQCDGGDCDITFCSQECKNRAVQEYHQPTIEDEDADADADGQEDNEGDGGNDSRSTNGEANDSAPRSNPAPFCGNPDLTTLGRPTNTTTPEWDLYFLLLTRTLSMSITQTIPPLSLLTTKYLWGDFQPSPWDFTSQTPINHSALQQRTLPFSLNHSLQLPLDFFSLLSTTTSHPAATPYTAAWLEKYDFWIIQTLYAKLRGVANASQSTFDGKPEIAAVHLGWCLANHSCAPNVRWTPKGTRKFFVRTAAERQAFAGREEGRQVWNGIKAGEEIFSHYTDVRLPVQERRDRLREVLGGNCRCERCLIESDELDSAQHQPGL